MSAGCSLVFIFHGQSASQANSEADIYLAFAEDSAAVCYFFECHDIRSILVPKKNMYASVL